MKKRISLFLVLVMSAMLVFGLAGCGTKEAEKPAITEDQKSQIILDAVKNYYETLPKDSNKIDYKDVKKKVDANDATIQIVDIRKAEDFAKGHIKGAINVPYGNDFTKDLAKIEKGKTNIIVCYTGQTAGQTVSLLKIAGYNAKAMHLGMKGWDAQADSGPANGFAQEK